MRWWFIVMLVPCLTFADTVRMADGSSCSFDVYNSPWEVSVGAEQEPNDDDEEEQKIKAEIKYKFGGPERLDCRRLYDIQIRIKQAELKLLEQQLKMQQASKTIDWGDE